MFSCGEIKISPMQPTSVNSKSVCEFCAEASQITSQIIKVMFVLYMSGSNSIGNFNGPATDPAKAIRQSKEII